MFSSSRTRTGDHALAGELKSSNGLLSSDGRKLSQEFIKRVAAFEVVEQRLHRHASPNEDRGAAEDLGVTMNHRQLGGHDAIPSSVYRRHELHAAAEEPNPVLARVVFLATLAPTASSRRSEGVPADSTSGLRSRGKRIIRTPSITAKSH